jgi:bifunctional oligoribonuclease and PAP phosphatase NrnA
MIMTKLAKKEILLPKNIQKEFRIFSHVVKETHSFLLIAHPNPDADTLGSTASFFFYLKSIQKRVVVTCKDALPKNFSSLFEGFSFTPLENIDFSSFEVIIACDSVDRSLYSSLLKNFDAEKQIITIIDHHPDTSFSADINIVDEKCSSACEIVSSFFIHNSIPLTKKIATCLLTGILGDTGNFQHSNTTPQTLCVTSHLLNKGAPLEKILSCISTNKKISTLRLWGRAFEKAKVYTSNGMIVSGITEEDLLLCKADSEDISQVANMLATVPDIRFALILSQHNKTTIKGSFRSEPQHNTDVSRIAHSLGGGGHTLASGFQLYGKLIDTENGWAIE